MTAPDLRMLSRAELLEHVAKTENAYVQRYARSVFDEQDELERQLGAIELKGYTDDGKEAMRKVKVVALWALTILLTYVLSTSFRGS